MPILNSSTRSKHLHNYWLHFKTWRFSYLFPVFHWVPVFHFNRFRNQWHNTFISDVGFLFHLSSIDLMHTDLGTTSLDLNYDGSQSPGSGGSLTQQTRNKRMRTSFKHHQLRTMKSYFAINQNPDAKDLKQLSQKTGLSKRVLQVIITTVNVAVYSLLFATKRENKNQTSTTQNE